MRYVVCMFHGENTRRSSVSSNATEFGGRYYKTYETIITLGAMEYQQLVSVQYLIRKRDGGVLLTSFRRISKTRCSTAIIIAAAHRSRLCQKLIEGPIQLYPLFYAIRQFLWKTMPHVTPYLIPRLASRSSSHSFRQMLLESYFKPD